MDMVLEDIHQFLIEEFRFEVSHGLSRLKKIPDTIVQGFLLYFAELEATDQDALIEVLTRRSLYFFFPNDASTSPSFTDSNLHYQRFRDAWRERTELRPQGARELKTFASLWEKGLFPAGVPRPPEGYLEMAKSIEVARAPQIRKGVKNVLGGLLGGRIENLSGGVWL
jgi:hypothetical protein